MKLRLGHKSIQISCVKHVRSVGHRIAMITFKSGESIKVICGVEVPDRKHHVFPGTPENLKSLIQRLK